MITTLWLLVSRHVHPNAIDIFSNQICSTVVLEAGKELQAFALVQNTLCIEHRDVHVTIMLLPLGRPQAALDPGVADPVVLPLVRDSYAMLLALRVRVLIGRRGTYPMII